MVMFEQSPERTEQYARFEHPTPPWYAGAGLGIFIHWGPYSVPAWAEPIGALGTVADKRYWFTHNPYAEWYFNTIRIEGSPARAHHEEAFGGAPYDDFLDAWSADAFDAAEFADLFRRAGARYVIPTTKHHDGVTLWDAPGTGDRNTVARGPKRDLVAEIASAVRAAGLRFGVYYSSGLDWHVAPKPPIVDEEHGLGDDAPNDEAYARYLHSQVIDLIDRYEPSVLWGDIGVPTVAEGPSDFSVESILDAFYSRVPDGVVNDRWGATHWDFRTSEYEQGASIEGVGGMWERNRGVGFSFGYNRVEGAETSLTGPEAVRMLVDVVSRGGNLLLNVGPDAHGRISDLQRACLEGLASWMAVNDEAIHGARPAVDVGTASDEPVVRWTRTDDAVYAIVEGEGRIELACDPTLLVPDSAAQLGGGPAFVSAAATGVVVDVASGGGTGPVVVRFEAA
ncbi:alpha-L-fucosidase [Frondihabitans australicus]|uniref:alpha-L-fucosidase n=1 Tax=Frondihabitans australicus TaxID=386892 RepID=A0A495IH79_9MICO|nr:alpha-L-fucosidase [Frondihabitans australicus]RKR75050.1 alpha-L-fucosidase [Frondihabitans australicus]